MREINRDCKHGRLARSCYECELEARIQTMADKAFGPFQEQSIDENLTEIERGINVFHAEIERRGERIAELEAEVARLHTQNTAVRGRESASVPCTGVVR